MGKCYCDYCDVFLTNDSVAVRKQHNEGNRHKYNVCEYYRQYIGQQLQKQIDQIVHQFELNVAAGLIRPTYGLPPATKAHIVLQSAQSASATPPAPDAPQNTTTPDEQRAPHPPPPPPPPPPPQQPQQQQPSPPPSQPAPHASAAHNAAAAQ